MQVKFWGTRGSIAKPGATTIRYGGNTSCIEVRSDAGTLVVIDCGTGSHALGQALCADQDGPRSGHLLISHTHWDHIQGIPFFAPLFVPGWKWDIYGPRGLSSGLRATLAGQMEHTYFPVSIDELAARISYHDLVEGQLNIGDIKVTTHYLNHPALTLGYRLEVDGVSVAYCCDHEPHSEAMADGRSPISGTDRRHLDFIAGADLVIHDAQYTAQEYAAKQGWGHSTVEYALRVCREAGVRQLALTHHDPLRDDAAIDQILNRLRKDARQAGAKIDILAAAEGLCLELHGSAPQTETTATTAFEADACLELKPAERRVLVCVQDTELAERLLKAATAEGFACERLSSASDLLERVQQPDVAVVLIGHVPPDEDGLALIRTLRANAPAGTDPVPTVLVTAVDCTDAPSTDAATDWLTTPFTDNYARTKMRAWALRSSCRWIRALPPKNEAQRLKTLHKLRILDTPAEERFDNITRIAATAFAVPVVLVSLVDADRQWFKSCHGLDVRESDRDVAFCAHVVQSGQELVVPDAHVDARFADNPLATNPPHIRFYAGVPLLLADGHCIGTLCLIDFRPRELSDTELNMLRDLRDLVLREILATDQA